MYQDLKTESMDLTPLTAISPVDGRYHSQTKELHQHFSEWGLIKFRVLVEIEYFIALSKMSLPQLENLDPVTIDQLRRIISDFSVDDGEKVKELEKKTNHDVKAVEYYLKDKFKEIGLEDSAEFLHFGLTSQDINNTAIPLLLKQGLETNYWNKIEDIQKHLSASASLWKGMRTADGHGGGEIRRGKRRGQGRGAAGRRVADVADAGHEDDQNVAGLGRVGGGDQRAVRVPLDDRFAGVGVEEHRRCVVGYRHGLERALLPIADHHNVGRARRRNLKGNLVVDLVRRDKEERSLAAVDAHPRPAKIERKRNARGERHAIGEIGAEDASDAASGDDRLELRGVHHPARADHRRRLTFGARLNGSANVDFRKN